MPGGVDRSASGETFPTMATVHMKKLAVGIRDVPALRRRIAQRLKGRAGKHIVLTRMVPTRADELREGGSLYWVISGHVRARQRIRAIEPFGNGKAKRCRVTLDPDVIETERHPHKPFQGWRYLAASDAPGDLRTLGEIEGLSPSLHRELADLGLL